MTTEQQQTDFGWPEAAGIRRDGTLSRFSAALRKKKLLFFFLDQSQEALRALGIEHMLAADFNRLEDLKGCQDLVCNGQEKKRGLVFSFTAFNKDCPPWRPC